MTSLPPSDLPPVISPTKQALRYFLEKKEEEFKHLNGRLDVYIKKVQTLEDSKSQLTAEKNKLIVEVNKLKTSKETEIEEFESRLEHENQLYDKILQENEKNKALADEYEQKLNEEIKAHEVTEDALKLAQWKLSEKEGQLVARNQEIKNLESKLLERKEECQGLLAMRAELVSKTKTHQKDIVEIRRQLQVAVAKRVEVESEMKTRYEEMLARQLQELRNELETSHKSEYYELRQKYLTAVAELTTVQEEKRTWSINVKNLRLDLSQWQSKCGVLQQMHTKGWEELSSVREEKRKLEIDIENLKLQLKLQIGQWESKYASLVKENEDSEKLREADNRRFEEIIAQKDDLIKKKKLWIVKNHEYDENLREVNQMLDSDIKDYRRMIEEEEGRLNTNRSTRRSLEFNSGTKEEATLIVRTEEAASQEITMETSAKATSQFYEEVTVIMNGEPGTQEFEEATLIGEEARVTRTDEGASQEITMETSAEHHPPPSKIR